jgi:hypothetical protein
MSLVTCALHLVGSIVIAIKSRRMRREVVEHMTIMTSKYSVFVINPQRYIQLWRRRFLWEDNIKTHQHNRSIQVSENDAELRAFVITLMNLRIPGNY